ncbi:DUF2127 domain-containing protein [Pelagicoccus albus]|uniref:DUF2127 domain-containing protein n=1 Tax=Pelagicoccus albus TaxID=415222 RepID=A0A7X1E9F0_9BACT|nr:DUF2127 domain-containing protein [Pelagicoccus albus]MBC2607266.1 DUF2127 domain-containing protein [Pelagicoccus albus]
MTDRPTPKGLKAVALVELAKGVLALLAAVWFLYTLGDNWAEGLSYLNTRFAPSIELPERLFDLAQSFDRDRQVLAISGLTTYSVLHIVEGIGLWKSKLWAEWLGTISGGVYIPFEIIELVNHPSWLTAAILSLNVSIVIYLIFAIKSKM